MMPSFPLTLDPALDPGINLRVLEVEMEAGAGAPPHRYPSPAARR